MRTWEDYKDSVKSKSEQDKKMIEEIETISQIISLEIEKCTSIEQNDIQ